MQISSTDFRSKCFKILENIDPKNVEVIIEKRGKHFAKLTQIESDSLKDPMLGSLVGVGRTAGDLTEPVVEKEDWDLD